MDRSLLQLFWRPPEAFLEVAVLQPLDHDVRMLTTLQWPMIWCRHRIPLAMRHILCTFVEQGMWNVRERRSLFGFLFKNNITQLKRWDLMEIKVSHLVCQIVKMVQAYI